MITSSRGWSQDGRFPRHERWLWKQKTIFQTKPKRATFIGVRNSSVAKFQGKTFI